MEIKRYTQERLAALPSRTDYARLDAMTDGEAMQAAESDPDNPPLTDGQLANMRPVSEVMPWLANKGGRGRPIKENPKVSVTVRLNPDVLAYFKQGGQGWQTRLNDALQEYMKLHPDKAA